VTPDEYRAAIARIGVTPSEWARASGQNVTSVNNKTSGLRGVQAMEELLLKLAARCPDEIKALGAGTPAGRPKRAAELNTPRADDRLPPNR